MAEIPLQSADDTELEGDGEEGGGVLDCLFSSYSLQEPNTWPGVFFLCVT